MATFSLDVANEPTYVDIIDIAAGYGIFSTPVDGILPGDQVQGLTLVVTPASGGAAVVSKSIDASLRADGYFEYVTQSEIDAHFTFEAADIAALQGSNSWLYSASASVYRAGQTFTREYQGGSIAVRPTVPLPPMLVNSITVAPATLTRAPGATGQLTATTFDGYGNVITGQPIAWASTNPAIAYVDVNGLVTFVTPGTVTITATCQGLTASSAATCSSGGIVPSTGDVLFYNGSLVQWEPHSPIADRIQPGTFGGATAYHFAHGLIVDASGFTVTAGGITVTAGTSAVQALTATTGGFSGGVTAPTFTGALVGNASTATALATPRTINGVAFDGTGNIVVTAAAGTLTGSTLASNVVTSSLTTVGVLASPHMTGAIVDSGGLTVTAGTTAVQAFTATTGGFSGAVTAPSFSGSILGALVNVLTFGTHLTGSSYNNSAPVTLGVDATSANTASAIVSRDASGNFTAGTITAATGFTVSAGTASLQAMTATTGSFSSTLTVVGSLNLTTNNAFLNGTLTAGGGGGQRNLIGIDGLNRVNIDGNAIGAVFGGSVGVSNGFTVAAGTSALQALTATTATFSGNVDSANRIRLTTNATFFQGVTVGAVAVNVIGVTGNANAITRVVAATDAGGIDFTNQAQSQQWATLIGGILTISSGLTVTAGTSALQALTATTYHGTGASTFDARVVFGTNTPSGDDTAILVARTLTTTINSHAFRDESTLTPNVVGAAYASYDAIASIGSANNWAHYHAFQDRPNVAVSGGAVLAELVGFWSQPMLNAGSATTNRYGTWIKEVAGTGTIVNDIGIRIEALGAGSSTNYAIQTIGSTQSIFGGYVTFSAGILAGSATVTNPGALVLWAADDNYQIQFKNTAGVPQGGVFLSTGTNLVVIVNTHSTFFNADGTIVLPGTLQTSDPGSGAGAWQLGKRITAAAALDVAHYVETKIDGVVVKLAIVT